MDEKPKIGVGVIILNTKGLILLGKRSNIHAPYYSIPGGHLEIGETFEEAAIREVKEETDLDIIDPKVIAVTNNLQTFVREGVHYISIILLVKKFIGVPRIMEPEKCSELLWVNPRELPMPHFDASMMAIECFLENIFYKKT